MSLVSQGRRLSVPPLVHLEGQRGRTLGGGGVEVGVPYPVLIPTSSLDGSAPYSKLFPFLHQGEGSSWGGSVVDRQGGNQAGSPLSRLLQPPVCCAEGNGFVEVCNRSFAPQLLCPAYTVQDGDQPVGPPCSAEGRLGVLHRPQGRLLTGSGPSRQLSLSRFFENGQVFQFKALCFDLSTAPQSFTRVMAPVSVILHGMGIQILRYLDDWLVLDSSRVKALWARDKVLSLCRQLGIVVNNAKSHLIP